MVNKRAIMLLQGLNIFSTTAELYYFTYFFSSLTLWNINIFQCFSTKPKETKQELFPGKLV